jgi:glycosyltransferase involved in cell wall biosynthesis
MFYGKCALPLFLKKWSGGGFCVILAGMSKTSKPNLSLIIPVFNEAENVGPLHQEITESCRRLGRTYEIIFVDDGSFDETFIRLKQIQASDSRVHIIRLRKNFGQTPALAAGFDHSQGDIIITLDGDLQMDSNDFGPMLAKLEEGYDIVNGWRKNRHDKFLTRRIPSSLANWLISTITHVKLHDYGCSLKAYRREVIDNIRLYGELHRFIPAIASNMGITLAEVVVNHRPRTRGKSKYNIWRFPKVILDLITVKFLLSYSTRPLQSFGIFGLISGLGGIGIGAYLSYVRLFKQQGISDRPLLLLAILLIVVSIQFITLGLLAEIMVRSYHESSDKRIYYIREILESKTDNEPGREQTAFPETGAGSSVSTESGSFSGAGMAASAKTAAGAKNAPPSSPVSGAASGPEKAPSSTPGKEAAPGADPDRHA